LSAKGNTSVVAKVPLVAAASHASPEVTGASAAATFQDRRLDDMTTASGPISRHLMAIR
jgi:hypothetical protein